MLEYKSAVEMVESSEQKLAELLAAITQGKTSGNTSADTMRNLTSTYAEKKRQSEAIKQVALEKKKALEDAKAQEKAAELDAERSHRQANYTEVDIDGPTCVWIPDPSCLLEFTYGHETIMGCTDKDRNGFWCSLDATYVGQWQNCTYSCGSGENAFTKGIDGARNSSTPARRSVIKMEVAPTGLNGWGHGVPKLEARSESKHCYWKPDPRCKKGFRYEGTRYTACASIGMENDAWCSLDKEYVGRWIKCSYHCEVSASNETDLPDVITPEKSIESNPFAYDDGSE